VLKPVDDTRMLDKLAASLRTLFDEMVIYGYPGQEILNSDNKIRLVPSTRFKRLTVRRILQPFLLLLHWIRIRPAYIVINTHELLLVATCARILLGSRIVYDILENYYLNIRYIPSFPRWARWPLAFFVRVKEYLLSPFIYHFLISDACYARQIGFLHSRYTLVENRVCLKDMQPRTKDTSKGFVFCFTGTLAESTGVFTAIQLVKRMHTENPSVRLTIAGYCASQKTLRKIKEEISDYSFISLTGGDTLVPHRTIIEVIQQAHVGIISYPSNPATKGKLPTKLYEYLGNELPILMTPFPEVESFCQSYSAAIVVHSESSSGTDLINQLQHHCFYPVKPDDSVTWESQEPSLMAIFAS